MIEFFTLKPANELEIILFIISLISIPIFLFIGIRFIRKLIYPIGEEKIALLKERCLNRGLTLDEANLFLEILKKEKIENYNSYLENFELLKDLIIKYIYYYSSKKMEKNEIIAIKNKLYRILNSSANIYKKRKIFNTYSLKEGTKLKIQFKSKFFDSKVILCNNDYLIIERVNLIEDSSLENFEHLKITIYFYEPDDAGYSFETTIIKDIKSKKINALIVEHSDNLRRHQKRRFIRKTCSIPCELQPIKIELIEKKAKQIILNKIFNGTIINISINGAEIEIKEKNIVEIFESISRVYIKFKIENEIIKLIGEIVSKEENFLHIKIVKIFEEKDYLINDFIYLI
ncbi:MAG: PilZ domain-containing protein [Spirochaetes bacterium]|nr:PilZ domain-containing protein [Spirochaetota bacterium]